MAFNIADPGLFEGTPFSGTIATFNAGDVSGVPSAVIDWGDGTIESGRIIGTGADGQGPFDVRGEHTYADDGVYSVAVTLSVDGGASIVERGLVDVDARTPTLTALPTTAALGEEPRELVVARLVDPNPMEAADDFDVTAIVDANRTVPARLVAVGDGRFDVVVTVGFPIEEPPVSGATLGVSVTERVPGETPATTSVDVPIALATPRFEVAGTTIEALERSEVNATVASITPAEPGEATPDQFRAAVDWGDGTGESVAAIARDAEGRLVVNGAHTYAEPGLYAVRVRVTRTFLDSGAGPAGESQAVTRSLVAQSTVNVARRAGLSAALAPSSDTGVSASDGITRLEQPTLAGSARPLSVVEVFARRTGVGEAFPIGRAVATNAGTWQLKTPPLLPGSFEILARETTVDGETGPLQGLTTIVIDTHAPRVLGIVFDPRTRLVGLSIADDLSGLDAASLLDPGNYSLIGPPLRRAPAQAATVASSVAITPADPSGIIVTFPRGIARRQFPSHLRVLSGGVRDLAGNALDGESSARLPTGDGVPGGDFLTPLARRTGRLLAGPSRPGGLRRF